MRQSRPSSRGDVKASTSIMWDASLHTVAEVHSCELPLFQPVYRDDRMISAEFHATAALSLYTHTCVRLAKLHAAMALPHEFSVLCCIW